MDNNEIKQENRLISEKSPYLLQHAYNPVNWFPWDKEAFEKAKREDKPIFLSIGYSTCHWCHVMERESFEDEEVANILNKNFISIKVDREERPDIDAIYMSVCQAMTGQGGWPLTIFMTPDKKPFFAGTYFPKNNKYGRIGIIELSQELNNIWRNDRRKAEKAGDSVIDLLNNQQFESVESDIGSEVLHLAYNYYERSFDPTYGGFGKAPKFPTPHNLLFLLRYWKMTGIEQALQMVERTLKSMYQGGIYDHIGGGFARYSTDERWLVPHFEKMLYDNALLAIAYLECYQATSNEFYADVARDVFSYILKDMTLEEGAFLSAEDADSEGVEGKFYVWSPDEIILLLGKDRGEAYCRAFDITDKGNFEESNIPNLIGKDISLSKEFMKERELLFAKRDKRVHPFRDDKVLTSWNGLMIAALALGYRVLAEEKYINAAERAFEFIANNLIKEDGRLYARYRDGSINHLAYVDDYAFLIWGLIELYQATFKLDYLKKALELNEQMIDLFWDNQEGGLYLYARDAEELIIRPKELYDGAMPSANSVAAVNFIKLAALTGDIKISQLANSHIRTFGGTVLQSPVSYAYFLTALYLDQTSTVEVSIVGHLQNNDTKELLNIAKEGYNPQQVIVVREPKANSNEMIQEQATAFVCSGFVCNPPVVTADELKKLLHNKQTK